MPRMAVSVMGVLKVDIAASQCANTAIAEIIEELRNAFHEGCIQIAYAEQF